MYIMKLSDRCALLREEAVNQRKYEKNYFMQQPVYYLIGWVQALKENRSLEEVLANGAVHSLENFTPFIAPQELIVGFNLGTNQGPQIREFDRDAIRQSHISDEQLENYFAASEYLSKNPLPPATVLPWERFTLAEQQAKLEWAASGHVTDSNHSVIGYEKVLQLGFEGLLKEVEQYESINGSNGLYKAMKNLCMAACNMGEKYAAEASRLLASQDPAYNPDDLQKIVIACTNVPRKPAGSFQEAVQALWFAHIINTWEDGINANSLGRLDQILYPYYQADIEKGILTKEQAFEIICCLWIKLYLDYDVQQSCIGGTTPDGRSCVNELSYMMLDATEQLNFIRCMSVRYGKNTEREFLRRALEVVGHVQKGVPFFFNDDVMTKALMYEGIKEEDAFDYTQIGCVETVIPGKSNPHAVSGQTNLMKAIEYVFCNGNSMMYPEYCPGIQTGTLDQFDTWEKFYDAVLAQIDRIIDLSCGMIRKTKDEIYFPRPYKSLLTEGCIESGRDFNNGGATYDYYQVDLGGIPNLADSLIAIKKFVFTEKKYTLQQLKDILESNFSDESIRAEFMNKVPKFGNDIDEVDQFAVNIMHHACDTLKELSAKYELPFHAQPFTFVWMLNQGEHGAASPDGRRKGEPYAYSVSPMQGRDFNGLTAVFNSIAKLPGYKAAGTCSAIIEADPKLFTDMNLDTITDILIASSLKGLSNVQFNIIDADTLIDAKKHPEHYNNLAVRVSGFSQKFNLLDSAMQDHIIGRTKHSCM